MTREDIIEEKRAAKVAKLVAFLRSVHEVLPSRLPIVDWVTQSRFPFAAMERAAGVLPCSPTSKARVLVALRGES